MATAASVQVAPDAGGSKVDANSLTRGAATVLRQNVNLASSTGAEVFADPVATDPSLGAAGLPTRPIPAAAQLTLGGTSPGSNTVEAGAAVTVEQYDTLEVIAELTGATGGTLDTVLETSHDGTTWEEFARFAQKADAAAVTKHRFSVSRKVQQTTITTIGRQPTAVALAAPVISANSVVGGGFGKYMRTVYYAGVGTTVGAAQVIMAYGHRA